MKSEGIADGPNPSGGLRYPQYGRGFDRRNWQAGGWIWLFHVVSPM